MAKTKQGAAEFSVEIDAYQLDQEWVKQPGFYHRYAVQLADAKRVADGWKAQVEVVRAELYTAILADPGQFGLTKTTEEAVKNCITIQPAYRQAQQQLLEARHAVDILEAAVAAIDQKKRALESLVQLQLSDYYAKPRAPKAAECSVESAVRRRALERSRAAADAEFEE
jgi:hypothetical protein